MGRKFAGADGLIYMAGEHSTPGSPEVGTTLLQMSKRPCPWPRDIVSEPRNTVYTWAVLATHALPALLEDVDSVLELFSTAPALFPAFFSSVWPLSTTPRSCDIFSPMAL